MSNVVRITDVAPRDGLQNEPGVIPTAEKVRLVELLCATGVDEVEVSSFVSPKWVPQLGDAAEVFAALRERAGVLESQPPRPASGRGSLSRPVFSVLVPNEKGLEGAIAVNGGAGGRLIDKVSVFTAASETFSKKNTNATIAETLARFVPVIERAHASGLRIRGYVSCVIACPFEGAIAPAQVARVAAELLELGVDEIDLGDTIGAGTPESVGLMLRTVGEALDSATGPDAGAWLTDPERLTLHLHDTFGHAAECVRAALDLGVRSFDGSAGGLGGCPYASTPGKRAPGNIATGTLVETVHRAGFRTGVDLAKLAEAAAFAMKMVGKG
jgi:hydroxymethylglutaryl-CoA lyase